MNIRLRQLAIAILTVSMVASLLPADSSAIDEMPIPNAKENALNKIYYDESHCLTLADMRGDQDMPISCYCRDAIVEARYVNFTYLLSSKDLNLTGIFIVLAGNVSQKCGQTLNAFDIASSKNWKWDGPEVIRTYPPDGVVKRIKPNNDGVRLVPFTIQLIYRDDKGGVTRTENYSSYYPDLRFK